MAQGLKINNWKQNIFKNNLVYIILSQIIAFIAGFIKLPIYSNIFPPEDLGNYTLVVSSLSYIDIVVLSWISSSFWRFIYEKETSNSFNQLFSTLLPTFFVIGLLGTLTSITLSFTIINYKGGLILFLLGYLSILSQQMVSFLYMLFQSKKQIRKWCITLCIQNIFSLILFLILVNFYNADIKTIFLSSIFINTFILFIWFWINPQEFKPLAGRLSQAYNFRKVFKYSLQSTLVNILLLVLINADRFMISNFKGAKLTGIYAQIYSVAFVGLSYIIQSFTTLFIPFYNKAVISKTNETTPRNIIKLYLIIFTPLWLFLLLNSEPIIQLLLSSSYHRYSSIFAWVVSGIYFYGLANFYEIRLKLLNKIKLVITVLFIVALINIFCNIYLLKNYSIEVSAIITFACYLLFFILLIYLNRLPLKQLNFQKEFKYLFSVSTSLIILNFLIKHNFPNQSNIVYLAVLGGILLLIYIFLFRNLKTTILYCYKLIS